MINVDVQCRNCHTEFHWIYANETELKELDMNDCPECGVGKEKLKTCLEYMENKN